MNSPQGYVTVLRDELDDNSGRTLQKVTPPRPTEVQQFRQAQEADAFRAEEDAAREWVRTRSPDRHTRHFCIVDGSELIDEQVNGPRRCEEVFCRRPEFVPSKPCVAGPYSTELAIDLVKRIPSLSRVFDAGALARIDELESRLVWDEAITASARSKIDKELRWLHAPGQTFWERWVRYTDPRAHRQFDQLVTEWSKSEVDMSEAHLFDDGWRQVPFGLLAAGDFFWRLPSALNRFLGVEVQPVKGFKGRGASITLTATEANLRSRRIGCGIRFTQRALGAVVVHTA